MTLPRQAALLSLLLVCLAAAGGAIWLGLATPGRAEVRGDPSPTARIPVPPGPMQRPRGFRKRTQFEPSAVLWLPELDRYLIVSDDTGIDDVNDHAPWVFTMTRDGRVDPEPLVVGGLEAVIDLESVARGPAGLYLLSSQSASSRGRRPAGRELLVLVRIGPERRLTAAASVPLLAAIVRAAESGGGERWLAGLGLSTRIERMTRPGPAGSDLLLDVEGMAWWRGALLLGLKEPLLPGGEAAVWRLARPDRIFETGVLDPADLTLFARLPLTLETEAGPVRQGISGLSTLASGELALTATVPGKEHFYLGALWLVKGLPASPSLRLVRTFPGLKPEGVTPSPEGPLTLVFDVGGGIPLWLRATP